MKRIVDRAEFDRISGNRCGACCETMHSGGDINRHAEHIRGGTGCCHGMTREETLAEVTLLQEMLEPIANNPLQYRCRHFRRDADGLGVCGIYERRPQMCSDFPYGRPSEDWPTCTWHVRLVRRQLPLIAKEGAFGVE